MKIYTIVILYNGAQWIEKCFGSLTSSSINTNIIAVDNDSVDESVEKLREKFPEVKVIKSRKNLGFGLANNIGIREAISGNADYIFLLNQDAFVQPDTLKYLIESHELSPNYGVLSPVHLDGRGGALDKNFANYMNAHLTPQFLSDLFLGKLQTIYKTEFVNAAAWLISRECVEKVGGFDPIFPHYGEDRDYVDRVGYHGLDIGIVPKSIIYHDRICKTHSELKKDIRRILINDTIVLKKTNSTFRRNILVYFKLKLDTITSLFLFKKFEEAKIHIKTLFKSLVSLKKIYRSYLISKESKAFLN